MSLEFSAAFRAQLDDLVNRTDAGSVTAVIRRAVAVYDHALRNGDALVLRSASGEQFRLVLP